jgi:hypothetical protein
VSEYEVAQLARLIKDAQRPRGACRTPAIDVARYLVGVGVRLPTVELEDAEA